MEPKPCPCCGYCPVCGRPPIYTQPQPIFVPQPYYQPNYPTITCNTSTGTVFIPQFSILSNNANS